MKSPNLSCGLSSKLQCETIKYAALEKETKHKRKLWASMMKDIMTSATIYISSGVDHIIRIIRGLWAPLLCIGKMARTQLFSYFIWVG
jgi:hypothetical protein